MNKELLPKSSINVSDIPQLDGNNSHLWSSSNSNTSLAQSSVFSECSPSLFSISGSIEQNNPWEDSWFSQNGCDTTQPQLVFPHPISVIISDRPPRIFDDRLPPVLQVIRRENRGT